MGNNPKAEFLGFRALAVMFADKGDKRLGESDEADGEGALPSHRPLIRSGNCFFRAVFWKSKRSFSCLALMSRAQSSFSKNLRIRSSLSCASFIASIASLTMLMVVKLRFPRPMEVFGPKRFP